MSEEVVVLVSSNGELTTLAVAWLLTFALHSTALLAATWSVVRFCRLSDPVREVLWKLAAFGAFLTSTLQCWFVDGAWDLPVAPAAVRTSPAVLSTDLATVLAPVPTAASFDWSWWLVCAVLLVAGLASLRWVLGRVRLHRLLASRRDVADASTVACFDDVRSSLGITRRVRLTEVATTSGPVAFGVWRPEVCLPAGLGAELCEEELHAMFAHELAHLESRDPLWLGLLGAAIRLFPWQPLLCVARRRFRELAEFRCDARAAEVAGGHTTARCLVRIAVSMHSGRGDALAVHAGMAQRRSALGRRVDRLLTEVPAGSFGRRSRRWVAPFCGVVLAATTLLMPGVGVSQAPSSEPADRGTLLDELADLDVECAALAGEFTQLQRELAGSALAAETVQLVARLGMRLNDLDRRRIALRTRILDALLMGMDQNGGKGR